MVTFEHFRFFLSFVPIFISLPLAWKAHENRRLDAAVGVVDINSEVQGIEDIELPKNIPVESSQKDYLGANEENDLDDAMKEVIELDDLLQINFGTEKRLSYVDFTKSEDPILDWKMKIRNWYSDLAKVVQKSYRKIKPYLESEHDMASIVINIFIFVAVYYFKPVITACSSYALRMAITPFIKMAAFWRNFFKALLCTSKRRFTRKCKRSNTKEGKASSAALGPRSPSNIKDPESISTLSPAVEKQQNETNRTDQELVFDEKKNWNGLEERKDNESSEWLEDSFIEGGIQTFSLLENENNRSGNRTEDYMQASCNDGETCEVDVSENGGPLTSTPAHSIVFVRPRGNNVSKFNDTKTFTPRKLKRFIHDKFNESGLGMAVDLNETGNTQVIIVDEQKKEKYQIDWGRGIDDFVNATKMRIRNRLMNMSYV